MTRTLSICSVVLVFAVASPNLSQAHEPGRIHQCIHCAKPQYSKLHYTLPIIYRLKAFLRHGVPEVYAPVWQPEIVGTSLRMSYNCPPVPPDVSAQQYFDLTDVPPELMTPVDKKKTAEGQ